MMKNPNTRKILDKLKEAGLKSNSFSMQDS